MKPTLYCTVMANDRDRTCGLQDVYHLTWDHGAWFTFFRETKSGFWMKNTPIPLQLLFIDKNYIVLEIKELKPHDKTIIRCEVPYKYALEVNPGWAEAFNITPGTNLNEKVELIFVENTT